MKIKYLIKMEDSKDKSEFNYLLLGYGGQMFTRFEPIPMNVMYDDFRTVDSIVNRKNKSHYGSTPHKRDFVYSVFEIFV